MKTFSFELGPRSAWSTRTLVGLGVLLLASLFIVGVYFFSGTKSEIASHDLVFDISSRLVSYRIGESPICGELDCWTSASFDASEWAKANLDETPMPSLDGFADRESRHRIYYRFELEIPRQLATSGELVAFSPLFVNHSSFEVFLNSVRIDMHEGTGVEAAIPIVAIPRDLYREGQIVVVVIMAKVLDNDLGINHFGGFYLGPKRILNKAMIMDERANISFFMLFMLAKGSIFLVLALILFLTRPYLGFSYFLVFAFCSTMEDYLRSSLFPPDVDFDVRTAAYFCLRYLASAALLAFFLAFLGRGRGRIRHVFIAISAVVALWLAVSWFVLGMHHQELEFTNLFALDRFILSAALSIACVAAYRTRMSPKGAVVLLRGFLSMSLAFILVDTCCSEYKGFEYRALFDLGFFLGATALCLWRFGLSEDLLEKRTTELMRAKVAEETGNIAQMLVHDLRKPLSMAARFAKALKKQSLDEDKRQRLVDAFTREFAPASERAEALVDDLLELSRVWTLDRSAVEIGALIEQLIADLGIAKDRLEVSGDLRVVVNVDAHKLSRALGNIIENAVQAARLGTPIRVEVSCDAALMRIAISNEGERIPESDVQRIFDVFYTSGKDAGTGLGLAISKRMVELHGGRIWCDSNDSLTSFCIEIPV